VILADCSSFKGLTLALLSFVALATFFGADLKTPRFYRSFALAVTFVVLINIFRLALLSLTPEMHSAIHSDTGKGIYDMLLTFIILALTLQVSSCSD